MPTTLKGGSNGNVADVNDKLELHVLAITETEEHRINEEDGLVWTLAFEDLNPAAADDAVIYLLNTGDENLVILEAHFDCAVAASQVEIHGVTGTATSGNTAAVQSNKVGSGASPTATIETGTDIGGLTSTGILALLQCVVADTQYSRIFDYKIILPKNAAISVQVQTGTANLSGYIVFAEERVR